MTDKKMTNEEAINYFKRSYASGDTDDERQHNEALDMAIKALKQQPKSGKWRKEWLTDSMTGRDGIYRVCSECGYEEDYYSGRKLDYCPRCGSRNKEGVDE